jgi:anti-sigma-K factor RskA
MSEIHGASGSYVLNALEPSERDEFEAHLAECETCSRELAELRETASEMSLLSVTAPPSALKSEVMAAISTVRVLPPEAPVTRIDAGQGALRRQRRTTRLLTLAVAAALVIALSLGAWAVSLSRNQAPSAAASLEAQLLQAPDLRAYTVDLKDGGKGTFIASRSLNRALFSSGDLPVLTSGQTYQLWTLAGPLKAPTRVTPDALVSGGATVKMWFTGPVAQSDALAISIERAGGATTPTNIQGAAAF